MHNNHWTATVGPEEYVVRACFTPETFADHSYREGYLHGALRTYLRAHELLPVSGPVLTFREIEARDYDEWRGEGRISVRAVSVWQGRAYRLVIVPWQPTRGKG